MKQKISITVDAVILAEEKNTLFVLLVKRKNEPYKNQWALPGGFLEEDELLEKGCARELQEETGLEIKKLEQVGVYDAVKRDPRGRTLSVAFTKKIKERVEVKGADDAADADWINLDHLNKLAFDHTKIIKDALEKLQINKNI